jgi:hypothetical protein
VLWNVSFIPRMKFFLYFRKKWKEKQQMLNYRNKNFRWFIFFGIHITLGQTDIFKLHFTDGLSEKRLHLRVEQSAKNRKIWVLSTFLLWLFMSLGLIFFINGLVGLVCTYTKHTKALPPFWKHTTGLSNTQQNQIISALGCQDSFLRQVLALPFSVWVAFSMS